MQLVLSCILGWVDVHTVLVRSYEPPSPGAPTPPFGLEGPLGLMAAQQKKRASLHSVRWAADSVSGRGRMEGR